MASRKAPNQSLSLHFHPGRKVLAIVARGHTATVLAVAFGIATILAVFLAVH